MYKELFVAETLLVLSLKPRKHCISQYTGTSPSLGDHCHRSAQGLSMGPE